MRVGNDLTLSGLAEDSVERTTDTVSDVGKRCSRWGANHKFSTSKAP
jgi:hypothetical protein